MAGGAAHGHRQCGCQPAVFGQTRRVLLTLTTTHRPATDLGFLLHKNPARAQSLDTSQGTAHVLYPQADEDRCTVALLLEVDPVALARGGTVLAQYVNDRPYAASSMLAVALGKAFGTARQGRCKERPDLVSQAIALEVHLPSLACSGGARLAERVFAPLGWQVQATEIDLDQTRPDWGRSRYLDVRLRGTLRLADALNQLYVALPVLDDAKHYWVGIEEIDKLLRAGRGWLAEHPERELIAHRYLARRRHYAREAMARLAESEGVEPEELDNAPDGPCGEAPDLDRTALAQQRQEAVLAALAGSGARRVVDLGCGDGALLPALLDQHAEVLGVDVSHRSLEFAARRLGLDRMPERQRARIGLHQSALTYLDDRLVGFDAGVLMEVIEHVDLDRLPALESAVWGHARPLTLLVTTPNAEYNTRYPGLSGGQLRHRDHRFEWTRAQFADWCQRMASTYGYRVEHRPVGDIDPVHGCSSQFAVFTRQQA